MAVALVLEVVQSVLVDAKVLVVRQAFLADEKERVSRLAAKERAVPYGESLSAREQVGFPELFGVRARGSAGAPMEHCWDVKALVAFGVLALVQAQTLVVRMVVCPTGGERV